MAGDPINWDPARMLRDRAEAGGAGTGDSAPESRFALVVLNQPLTDLPTLKTLWRNGMPRAVLISRSHKSRQVTCHVLAASLKVAADGGANRILDVCQAEQGQEDSTLFV